MRNLVLGFAALGLAVAIASPAFAPTGCSPCTRHVAVAPAPPAAIGHCRTDSALHSRCVTAWRHCMSQTNHSSCQSAWTVCCNAPH